MKRPLVGGSVTPTFTDPPEGRWVGAPLAGARPPLPKEPRGGLQRRATSRQVPSHGSRCDDDRGDRRRRA